jgi:hypothetical protein
MKLRIQAAAPESRSSEALPDTGRLLEKNGKKSVDVSGIACTTTHGFPHSCLVIAGRKSLLSWPKLPGDVPQVALLISSE